jgi:glutamine amidotransferase
MNNKICILDYGSGNAGSVLNAFTRLGFDASISNEVEDISKASHLVMPGVGAFKASLDKIQKLVPVEYIRHQIEKGKPFLGICVGMQVLAETGFEFEKASGLNFFNGSEVVELPESVIRPHVGWNNITINMEHQILSGIGDDADFYFVHSFYMTNLEDNSIIATCDYGLKFPAVVAKDNLVGVQFHPEKSQKFGDKLIRNFVGL